MLRVLGTLAGIGLLVLGLPLALSPIPLGLLMIAGGVLLLTANSPPFARWLARRRAKHDRLDHVLDRAAETLPDTLAEPLEATDPKQDAPPGPPNDAEHWSRH